MKERGEKPWHFVKASRSAVVGPERDGHASPAFSQGDASWEVEASSP